MRTGITIPIPRPLNPTFSPLLPTNPRRNSDYCSIWVSTKARSSSILHVFTADIAAHKSRQCSASSAVQKVLLKFFTTVLSEIQGRRSNHHRRAFFSTIAISEKLPPRGLQMCVALEVRLATALKENEVAEEEKLEKERSAKEALAYQESQMEMVVKESKKLEAQENPKNMVVNRPLAGTVRRGRTVDEDKELEHHLLNDEKQCAETHHAG